MVEDGFFLEKPLLRCGRHGELLDSDGDCPTCVSFRRSPLSREDRQQRMLSSIIRSADFYKCNWKKLENAILMAEDLGLTVEDIEFAIKETYFRHKAPLLELSNSEKEALERLTAAGIKCWRCSTGPFRHGFIVWKPIKTGGNARTGFRGAGVIRLSLDDDSSDDEETQSDAPQAWIYPSSDQGWYFLVSVFTPGPGPGDFQNKHKNLGDAVSDVLDYYFGDPSRMNPQELLDHMAKLKTNSQD
jgi:hypothetical protein